MISDKIIKQIYNAVLEHFHYFDPTTNESYGYSIPVGFAREVVSKSDGTIVINNYDTEPHQSKDQYVIGNYNVNTPTQVVTEYLRTVIHEGLNEENAEREALHQRLQESSIIEFC